MRQFLKRFDFLSGSIGEIWFASVKIPDQKSPVSSYRCERRNDQCPICGSGFAARLPLSHRTSGTWTDQRELKAGERAKLESVTTAPPGPMPRAWRWLLAGRLRAFGGGIGRLFGGRFGLAPWRVAILVRRLRRLMGVAGSRVRVRWLCRFVFVQQ